MPFGTLNKNSPHNTQTTETDRARERKRDAERDREEKTDQTAC